GAEEPDFGENEGEDAGLIVIGKDDLIVANDWIWPIRIGDVPQRSAAVDRWQRDKVFMRRRRGSAPLERPRVPGMVARYSSLEERMRDIPRQHQRPGAHEEHADSRKHVHPTPAGYVRISKDATRHAVKAEDVLDDEGHVETDDP